MLLIVHTVRITEEKFPNLYCLVSLLDKLGDLVDHSAHVVLLAHDTQQVQHIDIS